MRDNYHYLIVQTYENGRTCILARGDNKEEIEEAYLYLCRIHGEEISVGSCRLDIYEG